MRVIRSILAVVVGLVVGAVAVSAIESLGHRLHPLPQGLDPFHMDSAQEERFAEHVRSLPPSAFLLLLIGWSLGSFLAALVGRILAPERRAWPGLVAGGFFLVATVMMLFQFSHVLWLNIAAPIACVACTVLGIGLAAPANM